MIVEDTKPYMRVVMTVSLTRFLIICSLLILVTLLVLSGLGLIGSALLVVQSLPSLTENLADLAKADTWVLLTNVLALLVGEEHVSRETTLGRIWVLLLLLTSGLGGTLGLCFLRHGDGGFECIGSGLGG